MPAMVNVNRSKSKREAVMRMLPSDIYRVFSSDRKPSSVLTMRKRRETLRNLSAVTLILIPSEART